MKIIVDTNIIFSVLLNSNGKIGDLLFNSDRVFEFYSCDYLRHEIEKHWIKLKHISKFSELELREARYSIFTKINFINEGLIVEKTWLESEALANDIDIDDVDFIALTRHFNGILWTGDKQLYKGLKRKNFKHICNTNELIALRLEVERT